MRPAGLAAQAPTGAPELQPVPGPSSIAGGPRRFFSLLWVMSKTEFRLSFHGTALGYVWSLVRPLLLFGVLLAVFTQVFRFGGTVKDYPALLLLNIMLFSLFGEATTRAVTSVIAQEGVVRKTQFPRLVIPLSVVLTGLLNFALSLIAVFIFILAYGVDPLWTWLLFPVLVLALLVLTVAVSMILSALYPRFRDVALIWSVFSTVLFYATPILYPISYALANTDQTFHSVIQMNPLTPIFEQAQKWMIDPSVSGVVEETSTAILVISIAAYVSVCALAVWVFRREAPPDRRGALTEAAGKAAPAPTRPGIEVVIVSYRCRALLRDCLDSLRSNPPDRPMRVIVVDNASGDGTAEMVATGYPEVELHASGRNLGFAAATNLGARTGSAPFVLALNPDTRVTEGALAAMLSVMEAHPEVAVAGCRLVLEDGSFDHAAKRSFPTPLSALGHFSGLGSRSGAPSGLGGYRAPEVASGPVDAVNGAFMLLRRAALEGVGGFDEGYWMYMEDLDLCYRLSEAGWVTWYEPGPEVVHLKGGTTGGQRSPRLNWAFHRGMYRFYRRHYAPQRSWALNAAVYAGIALKLAAALIRSGARQALAGLRGSPATG